MLNETTAVAGEAKHLFLDSSPFGLRMTDRMRIWNL